MPIHSIDNRTNSNSFYKVGLGAVAGGALLGAGGYLSAASDTVWLKKTPKEGTISLRAVTELFADVLKQGSDDLDGVLKNIDTYKGKDLVAFVSEHRIPLAIENFSDKQIAVNLDELNIKDFAKLKQYITDMKIGNGFIAEGMKTISKWQTGGIEGLGSFLTEAIKSYKINSALKTGLMGFVGGGLVMFVDEISSKNSRSSRDCFIA